MRKISLVATFIALAAPAFAQAPAPPPAPRQITNPDWLKKPTAESLFSLWPPEAAKRGIGGRADIGCVITAQGTLRNCQILAEDPPGMGFGAAAIALTPQFLMKPMLIDGKPVDGGQVRLPIRWQANGMGPLQTTKSDRVYSNMPYREAPTLAEVLEAYPAKARDAKIAGVVTLNCRIAAEGRLKTCNPVREEPKGYGFGSAAKRLADRFVGPAVDGAGESVVGAQAMLIVAFPANALSEPNPVIGKPKWVAIPKINDLEAVMPAEAKAAKVYKARVLMSCKVAAGGAVDGCKAESEEPPGLGYGRAAEGLSKFFKLSVWTDEGLPTVGGSVRIPLRFDLPEPAATPPAKP